MKNKTALTLVIFVILSSLLACNISVGNTNIETIRGSGKVVSETREVSNISGVELALQGTLHISVGTNESLRIEAEDNLLGYILTDVSGGELVIKTKTGVNLNNTKPINYYLTVTGLKSIAISSSGDIEASDLVSEAFSTSVSSSGDLTISSLKCTSLQVRSSSSGNTSIGNLQADSINVTISSSGDVTIENGSVPKQDVNISSSGDYQADAVVSSTAQVSISSSGNATVRVSDQLSGRLSSSGNIYYIGNPSVNVSTSSSGEAIKKNP